MKSNDRFAKALAVINSTTSFGRYTFIAISNSNNWSWLAIAHNAFGDDIFTNAFPNAAITFAIINTRVRFIEFFRESDTV